MNRFTYDKLPLGHFWEQHTFQVYACKKCKQELFRKYFDDTQWHSEGEITKCSEQCKINDMDEALE